MNIIAKVVLISVGFVIGIYVQGAIGGKGDETTIESFDKAPIVGAVEVEKFSEPTTRPTRPGSRVIPPDVSSKMAR